MPVWSYDSEVRLWDVETGVLKTELDEHKGEVRSVAFSPGGKVLATGSRDAGDDAVLLWDVATGELKVKFAGHTGSVYGVAFSPDGKTLASGDAWPDYTVLLWDVATGELKAKFAGHTGSVYNVLFSPRWQDPRQVGVETVRYFCGSERIQVRLLIDFRIN